MFPPLKTIPVLRIFVFTGFSSDVLYCSSPCLTYTSDDFNLHNRGNSIVKKDVIHVLQALFKHYHLNKKQNSFSMFSWCSQDHSAFCFHLSLQASIGFKICSLEQVAQESIQMGLEYLQRRRLHSLCDLFRCSVIRR